MTNCYICEGPIETNSLSHIIGQINLHGRNGGKYQDIFNSISDVFSGAEQHNLSKYDNQDPEIAFAFWTTTISQDNCLTLPPNADWTCVTKIENIVKPPATGHIEDAYNELEEDVYKDKDKVKALIDHAMQEIVDAMLYGSKDNVVTIDDYTKPEGR